ncbi:amidase [Geodermatophilus sabuli]|uniref:Amidase n=1 Tax=Geodermatophilus sabuli TaxID=1564158 RepID=A0A7K3VYN4_9ACTN|nr:amidase [Geodermatophilus sabuli]NEK57014.1 amidase [Geodermatophilus sabuli]
MQDPDETPATQRWDEARARWQARDADLRAVITWIEESRGAAAAADRRRAAGESRGPLDGALVGLKDNIDAAGVLTTAGSAYRADHVAVSDAPSVALLRRAGAVVVAKLNMAELAWGTMTQNPWYGSCRNPWDTDRTAGGSSGGPGAALAAGYCDLALGTDTGGSVRIPAALNGVVGLRPSVGTISTSGVVPVGRSIDTVGPMGRSAVQVAQLADALRAPDPTDPWSTVSDGLPATALIGKPLDGMRAGVARDFFFDELDDGIGALVEDFLRWLADQGTASAAVPDLRAADATEHCLRIIRCEGAAFHQERLAASPQDFSPDVRARLSSGMAVAGTDLVRSLEFRQRYRRRLAEVFDDVDVVVTPVVPVEAPVAAGESSWDPAGVLGRATVPWSLHDGPTLSLPIGFHPRSGNPVGVSLAARRFDEATLFQVAAAYQEATDWHTRRP